MTKQKQTQLMQWTVVGLMIVLMYLVIDKTSLIRVVERALPGKEAGLVEGIILGAKEGMSKDFYGDLKTSGLVHIVVASGTNLMLISSILIEQLAPFLGRKKTIILGLAGMWGYASMVQWQAPIVRACLFLSIRYLAQLAGRRFEWKRGIGVTAAIMLMADISMISNVSFWMSMVAFGAVSVGVPKSQLKGWKVGIINSMGETVWVSLWLTPILALVFGQISWISPVSNVLVLFLVEGVSLVAGAGALVGLLSQELGKYILWLTIPGLRYFEMVVEWTSRAGAINFKFNWWMLVGWYLIMIYLLTRKNRSRRLVATSA